MSIILASQSPRRRELLGLFGIIAPTTSAFLHNASTMVICARSMTPMLEKKQNSATEEDTGKA